MSQIQTLNGIQRRSCRDGSNEQSPRDLLTLKAQQTAQLAFYMNL